MTKKAIAKVGRRSGLAAEKPYDRLLVERRRRPSAVKGRSLEEEADADRGRVLFCAPFRRLQNKAQVFSLETNAAVRSRLTHSLEVSSIGRYVAQQAIEAFEPNERKSLGLEGKERAFITFVETACLLHDFGNPPFGHFGEITISDWFHQHEEELKPKDIASQSQALWDSHYADFAHFDGNPQGFRITTRLQALDSGDLNGLNLTATTLAATLKYPWSLAKINEQNRRKKAGYFLTEADVFDWVRQTLSLKDEGRHPLAYLMEAADDIAYCISDIEDGIEKGLIAAPKFATDVETKLSDFLTAGLSAPDKSDKQDMAKLTEAINRLKDPQIVRDGRSVERLTPMQDFRSAVIRLLARYAGRTYRDNHEGILAGNAETLLKDNVLLKAIKAFAEASLYSSLIVRNREITAHAVISGLLDAYLPIMKCERKRFDLFGQQPRDNNNRAITRESSLLASIGKKQRTVYRESVRRSDQEFSGDRQEGKRLVMERIHRMRLVLDHIAGMTDEFALQSFHLIGGMNVNPYRN